MNSEKRLQRATAWQRNPVAIPESIQDSVERFLSSRERQFCRSEKLLEAWKHTLPAALKEACRLEGFRGGILTVAVLTGPYLHQMQTLKGALLKELKEQCPRSGLRQIKIIPGPTKQEPKKQ